MNMLLPSGSWPMLPPRRDLRIHVREDPLRATAGLRGLDLTAWRGRSGRRYVVAVHPAEDVPDATGSVLLAVRRDRGGEARLLGVADGDEAWVDRMRARGATEIHVHRLAADATARRAAIEDLSELRRVPPRGGPGPGP
ncbi:MAG TPA: hypothetical protein VM434_12475 [Beijerinckiaceae bacterium]|nr:hypothetical protein [Beijerinckiaceae bacterium]